MICNLLNLAEDEMRHMQWDTHLVLKVESMLRSLLIVVFVFNVLKSRAVRRPVLTLRSLLTRALLEL